MVLLQATKADLESLLAVLEKKQEVQTFRPLQWVLLWSQLGVQIPEVLAFDHSMTMASSLEQG